MATKHFENGITSTSAGGSTFISSDIHVTGGVRWVDSVNGNDSNAGTEDLPLATLEAAITASTSANGDIIIVKAGHSQTVTSSISITKILRIYGLGSGSNKPAFTVNGNIDLFNLGARGIHLYNLRFPAGSAAHTARINIDEADCVVSDCDFTCGANDLHSITITANGINAKIEGCSFAVSADGPDEAIIVESASAAHLHVNNCSFNAGSYNWDNAALYSAFAHLNYAYQGNTLTSGASIVHTAAAKGYVSGTVAGDGCHVEV